MTYTHGHHESVLRSHTWRTAENSAAYLLPHLRPGLSLLDIGCGPGTITADLARLVAPGQVVGLDASDDVVAQAEAYAAETGATNLRFEVGDLFALRYDDATFDVVHAHQVLQHLVDPVAALVELRRVLRPGGVLAARDSDYGAFAWAPGRPGARPLDGALSGRHRAQRARRPDRPVAARAWPTQPASTRSRCRARPGPSPIPSRDSGGAACGPIGSASPASPSRPWPTG